MRCLRLLIGSLALAGCAQNSDRMMAHDFGASVRHAVRMQTDFSSQQAFTTDGEKLATALDRYRDTSGAGVLGGLSSRAGGATSSSSSGGSSGGSSDDSGLVSVRGYYRDDGTYVQPHVRTRPDGDPTNNLGSN